MEISKNEIFYSTIYNLRHLTFSAWSAFSPYQEFIKLFKRKKPKDFRPGAFDFLKSRLGRTRTKIQIINN
jgi:hypothetical protein